MKPATPELAPFRQMLDLLPDIAFQANSDGEILHVNARFEEVSGVPVREAQGRWRDVFPRRSEFDLKQRFLWLSAQPGREGIFETAFVRRDGCGRMAEMHCRIVEIDGTAQMIGIARDRTDEIALRQRLESNELQFRTIAEEAPVAIFRADPSGNITYVNEAWADRLGSPAEELLGTGWHKHALDLEDYVSDPPWQGFTPDNELRVRTNRFRTADEEILEFQTLNRAQFDDAGRLMGFVGVMFDITDQAREWRAYAELKTRHSALIDLAPVGIFHTDANGALEYANDVWCRIAGISLAEARGDGWSKAVHPDDQARVMEIWSDVLEHGEGSTHFRFLHADGKIVSAEVAATVTKGAKGEVVGFVGAALDITREQAALMAAQKSNEQLALLAAQSRDAIFRLDLQGRCLYATPSGEKLMDSSTEELIGKSLTINRHPDDEERFSSAFRSLSSGSVNYCELEYRARAQRPPYEYHWLEAHGRLIRDKSGTPFEIVVSLRDISQRKNMEVALVAARDEAQAATRAKSEFLANMSHEIRTPMNGVLGYTELLANTELTEGQREQVGMIQDSGRAMMRLLNDILDLSKVESGKMTLMTEPFDIRHLMSGVVALNRPAADMKELDLAWSASDAVPSGLIGDKLRLRQVLGNLVGNAIKFTERGSVALAAHYADDRLRVEVSDTGIGIETERLDAIFDGFTQADSSIHGRFGGTGLGLSISRKLAELMGGTLHLESRAGGGSVAVLDVPASVAPRSGIPTRPVNREGATPVFVGRVLVAEDHPVNQALISAMLDKLGIEHEIASNGAETIAKVRAAATGNLPFDLILMDIEMPLGDGVSVARTLRDYGLSSDRLPIIALTANAFPEDVGRYLQADMQGHIAKPVTLASLSEALSGFSRGVP